MTSRAPHPPHEHAFWSVKFSRQPSVLPRSRGDERAGLSGRLAHGVLRRGGSVTLWPQVAGTAMSRLASVWTDVAQLD